MLWNLLRTAFRWRSDAATLVSRALALRREGRPREAEQILREAVRAFPRDAIAATDLAVVLLEQDRGEEGRDWLMRALDSDPRCAPAHYNLANLMRSSGRRDQAVEHYRTAIACDPEFAPVREEFMHALLEVCDWDEAAVQAAALRDLIARRPAHEWMCFISPLTAVYFELEPAVRREVAAFHAAQCAGGARPITLKFAPENNARMRIAYFSRDFRDHPVGHLLGRVFDLHDRQRFEVFAFSYGPDDGSVYRKAIAASVDRFVDVQKASDDEVAARIAESHIDLVIDLGGHTSGSRLGVLARRPAPLQAHYLGYPATTGAPYIDYFVTDKIATPPTLTADFSEQLAYLPHCFMVSDGSDADGEAADRSSQELPADAVVYCSFNNASRINRDVFGKWMEVLRAVNPSVLWLQGQSDRTVANLRKAAHQSGIDPARLIFAKRVPSKSAHFARLALADLVLDTVGWYNGHSSTSDALWAGVPVLTVPGRTFAGRVAASLVHAAGLSELVVGNLCEYVETAVMLGNDPERCRALKQKLAGSKATAPFFNTRRIVSDLEDAFLEMRRKKLSGNSAPAIPINS
jgi:protein O-GlcNAc transferase